MVLTLWELIFILKLMLHYPSSLASYSPFCFQSNCSNTSLVHISFVQHHFPGPGALGPFLKESAQLSIPYLPLFYQDSIQSPVLVLLSCWPYLAEKCSSLFSSSFHLSCCTPAWEWLQSFPAKGKLLELFCNLDLSFFDLWLHCATCIHYLWVCNPSGSISQILELQDHLANYWN